MTKSTANGRKMEQKVHRCDICGREEADAGLLEACIGCGVMFHLNPRNDVNGIDCGDAVLRPEFGVHFYCQNCIERAKIESARGEPPARRLRIQSRRKYRRIDCH